MSHPRLLLVACRVFERELVAAGVSPAVAAGILPPGMGVRAFEDSRTFQARWECARFFPPGGTRRLYGRRGRPPLLFKPALTSGNDY